MKKEPIVFLNHIQEEIQNIQTFTNNISFLEFMNDKEKRYAIVRSIEIIGEAAKHVPDNVQKANPDVPWSKIIGTRNRLVHDYFDIDWEMTWNIITESLPDLSLKIDRMIRSEKTT